MISSSESYRSSEARIVAPYPLTRTIRVKPSDDGKRVLDFFLERFPYLSEQKWQHRIDQGWICYGGEPLAADDRISSQQLIHHFTPRVIEPSVSAGVRILQDKDEWLLVCKPAPLPMHQGGRFYKNTLIYILSEMGFKGLRMVHRLDAVTSGLVILAKNRTFAATLRSEFEAGRVEKWYYAVVSGVVSEPFRVEAPIRRKRGFVFECGENLPGTKPAETRFEPVESRNGHTVVKCFPVTGRTHQIRLHLKHAGFPIVDDPIYGPWGDSSGKRLQNSAISLQSSGIKLPALEISAQISFEKILLLFNF
ncbi:MAG: RluA family pseudouridine synthase [Balneolaceae bacterium]|nr:RluA family pseudouridine synthase [Balneolaceae bacterium]